MKKKDFKHISSKKYDGMMGRCYRPTETSYASYGGKGIKVCSEWIKDINSFRGWLTSYLLKNGISIEEFVNNPKQYQIDRIDPFDHYKPSNCRLSNPQEQARNKRRKALYAVVSAEGEIIEI